MNRKPSTQVAPDSDPRSAAVLAQARHEIQARRAAAAHEAAARERPWTWVSAALAVGLLLVLVFWPSGSLADRLRWIMQGACDQIHNIPSWRVALPLDARCTGIYTGVLAAFISLTTLGRVHAARLPPRPLVIALLSLIAVMAVDGVNSFLEPYGHAVYRPHDALRLASGLGAGLALAVLGLPLINRGLRLAPRRDQMSLASARQLWSIMGLLAGIGMLAWQGAPWLFYPLALFSVAGTIGTVFLVNLVAITFLAGLGRRLVLLAQLARPTAISIALTAGELVVLAWVRDALEQGLIG